MPADLLLPAFALTLVLNALIVALAMRGLWAGKTERGGRTDLLPALPLDPEPAPPEPWSDTDEEDPAERPAAWPRPEPEAPELTAPANPSSPPAAPPGFVAAEPTDPAPASDPGPSQSQPARRPGAAARKGRRRKFSLPPLDEDHEKVSRSIETFLAGADGAAPTDAPSVAAPGPVSDEAPARAAVVTVAVIQLQGPGPHDLLERTVRSTARATDQVSVDRRGRVRVVLPGTGEVAAHAYLRRIRAIVEPIAESSDPPSRIVIATATELGGAVPAARRRADRRLALALGRETLALDLDEDLREPRAAGD